MRQRGAIVPATSAVCGVDLLVHALLAALVRRRGRTGTHPRAGAHIRCGAVVVGAARGRWYATIATTRLVSSRTAVIALIGGAVTVTRHACLQGAILVGAAGGGRDAFRAALLRRGSAGEIAGFAVASGGTTRWRNTSGTRRSTVSHGAVVDTGRAADVLS